MGDERNKTGRTRRTPLTLGQVIRQTRERAGLSIRQLEATSGVGRMAIQRLESDEVERPLAEHLVPWRRH